MELLKPVGQKYVDNNNYSIGKNNYSKINIDLENLENLVQDLNVLINDYKKYENYFTKLPVKIKFKKLLGKSRIARLFETGCKNDIKQIDSEFVFDENNNLKDELIVTYNLSFENITAAIENISILLKFVKNNQNEIELINSISKNKIITESQKNTEIEKIWHTLDFTKTQSKTKTERIVRDLLYIKKIELYNSVKPESYKDYYVKFQNIESTNKIISILKKNKISILDSEVIYEDQGIINTYEENLEKIIDLFPFLVKTANNNKIKMNFNEDDKEKSDVEPIGDDFLAELESKSDFNSNVIVGVIDTWVKVGEYWKDLIEVNNINLPNSYKYTYEHGTKVSTLIAANDVINNNDFKDGLGKFKVKSFGLIPKDNLSITTFLLEMEKIIKANREEIKIWNLSIEILNSLPMSFKISEIGKQFDRIQKENDVLFIISSGNSNKISEGADSLLAITVGSIFKNLENEEEISSYTGYSKLLGLYEKPNAYDFGNDINQVSDFSKTLWLFDDYEAIDNLDEGTSFAAPLLTRKCAYLMSKYNFSINEIKSVINIFSKYNLKQNNKYSINVKFEKEDSNSLLIVDKGKIMCGKKKTLSIKIPFVEKKNSKYKSFHPAIAVSYPTTLNQDVGCEYSSTEVMVKIRGYNYPDSKNKITSVALLKPEPHNSENELNNQKSLIEDYKKYNPNKVLFDNSFNNKEPIRPLNNLNEESVIIEVSAVDLFENKNKEIEYGYSILLRGVNEKFVKEFYSINSEVFEKIIIEEESLVVEKEEERIRIKQ